MKKLILFFLVALVGCDKGAEPFTAINQFGSDYNYYEGIFVSKDSTSFISINKNQKTKFINISYYQNGDLKFNADSFYYDLSKSKWFVFTPNTINYSFDVNWQTDSFLIYNSNNTKLPLNKKFIRFQSPLQ